MSERDDMISQKTFPWFRGGFNIEGIVGFLAAWLLGVLLGMVWEPLFWLAFIPGVILLFATRTAERVTSQDPEHIVAPCDGVIVSVEEADAPDELRMSGECVRIRISSSPFSANNIHAPVAGAIDRIEMVEGEPKSFAAMKAEAPGLARLFVAFSGDETRAAIAVSTGGLGPRLEVKADAGDRVRKGRTIATRRLGGWCDLYLPADVAGAVAVQPGRVLVGGETVLWDFYKAETSTPVADPAPKPQAEPDLPPELDEQSGPQGDVPAAAIVAPEVLTPQDGEDSPGASESSEPQGDVPDSAIVSPEALPPQDGDEAQDAEVPTEPQGDVPEEAIVAPEVLPPQEDDPAPNEQQSFEQPSVYGNAETSPSPDPVPESAPNTNSSNEEQDVSWLTPPAPPTEEAVTPEVAPPDVSEGSLYDPHEASGDNADESKSDSDKSNDPVSMFERLRRQARKLSGEDGGSGQ